MESLARNYPTGQIYVVWDNLNIHHDGADCRWARFNRRHGDRFHFVYTPLHASWVNQIEIWFSLLITLESGPADDPVLHARLCRVAANLWQLEMATHTWRWEPTPFRAARDELLEMLLGNFGWTLAERV